MLSALGLICPSRAPREVVQGDWPHLIPFSPYNPPDGWEGVEAGEPLPSALDLPIEPSLKPTNTEGCMADLGRGRGVNARWARAAKHHLTNDWLVGPKDEAVTVEVVFTALPEPTEVSKHEFLTGERCDLYLLVDGRFRPVGGTQVTDEFGVARWEVKATDLPDADAVTPAAAVLRADNSVGRFAIYRITRPGVQIVCFDIDGTLTVHDDELDRQISGRRAGIFYTPHPFKGAAPTARFWFDQGYLVLYMSRRDWACRKLSVDWLTKKGFPPGPVLHCSLLEACDEDAPWKARQARDWVLRCKAIIAAAYGNMELDELAMRAAGVSSSRCYITEPPYIHFAQHIKSYQLHLKSLIPKIPPATVGAPRCTSVLATTSN
eukprot:TRINITY_DN4200_c0_g1_i2.p1 TRINITY_DN4200_c0_g1~~TRINITY_DN4200_c0_g1_i2.p1  ORF type:complete len:384 (+),score=54.63 TRINITY_DN4200_c0_g1_i2:24-1154(+)